MRTTVFGAVNAASRGNSLPKRVVIIPDRLFGTTYVFSLQGFLVSWTLAPWRWDRYVVPKRRQTITLCVIAQKCAVLVCFGAEARNHVTCRLAAIHSCLPSIRQTVVDFLSNSWRHGISLSLQYNDLPLPLWMAECPPWTHLWYAACLMYYYKV
jgi:hypothetical protein